MNRKIKLELVNDGKKQVYKVPCEHTFDDEEKLTFTFSGNETEIIIRDEEIVLNNNNKRKKIKTVLIINEKEPIGGIKSLYGNTRFDMADANFKISGDTISIYYCINSSGDQTKHYITITFLT